MTTIPLTESAIRNAKRAIQTRFPHEKSAHLTEALAAACGFNSHAALLATLKAGDPGDPDHVLLEEKAFLNRLEAITEKKLSINDRALSFDLLRYPNDTEVIKTQSSRMNAANYANSARKRAWRNTMVAGINEAIDRRLFTVRPGDNRWPGANKDKSERHEPYVYRFSIANIPAVASVHDAGFEELSIHVALWPTPEGERWVRAANAGFLAGDVYASGWLERRDGAWLQVPSNAGRGWGFTCRKARLDQIAAIDIRPKGYADRGNFKL